MSAADVTSEVLSPTEGQALFDCACQRTLSIPGAVFLAAWGCGCGVGPLGSAGGCVWRRSPIVPRTTDKTARRPSVHRAASVRARSAALALDGLPPSSHEAPTISRTTGAGATSRAGMEQIREDFSASRRAMLAAFVELSDWARLHGFDDDDLLRLHGEFFDGNVKLKRACSLALLLASLRGWQ